MNFSRLSNMWHGRKFKSNNKQPQARNGISKPRKSVEIHPDIRKVLRSSYRQSNHSDPTDVYSLASSRQTYIIKYSHTGAPQIRRRASMIAALSKNASPKEALDTTAPRSPRFTEIFDDELAPSSDGEERPHLRRSLPSTVTFTHRVPAAEDASPGDRPFRSESRRSEHSRGDSIALVSSNDAFDPSFDTLASSISVALSLGPGPVPSVRSWSSARSASHLDKPLPEIKSDDMQVSQAFRVPVIPPSYNTHELPGFQWIAPMITTTSRPPHVWGWSKRWSCCQCDDAKTIVEQQLCSNLECQHIRCNTSCDLVRY